jgi:pilus assembly protein CpaB
MKKRLLSVLAFALAVSAGAAFVLYQLIASKVQAGVSSAPATTKILVAARDLEVGALVQDRDLRLQEFLTPPAGAITKKQDLVGRGVINAIHQDTPFFEASLAPVGAGAGFASIIPKGMRAFAVHVNDVVGVAGFAVAGMRVDVLVSGIPPGAASDSGGAISRTLLQNVQVLSAGQNYQKDAEGKPVLVQVVNILVTPQQAEIMNLAADQKIQLVLRNPADLDVVQTPGAITSNLFDGGAGRVPRLTSSAKSPLQAAFKAPAQPVAQPPARVTVEVFSGGKKSESTFAGPAAPLNPVGLNPVGLNPVELKPVVSQPVEPIR